MILLAVRWYLRDGLSYRDVEELLAERGVDVDHVTIYRWVQRFTPLVIDAARPCRHSAGDRWFVDETYVKGHCCVERSGTRWGGRRRLLRSDRDGQFIERCRESQVLVAGVDAEFVVAASNVLDERMTADHRRRGPTGP